jgi:hypothetical protein
MRLAACVAARTFGSRTRSRPSRWRAPWSSVALRWRRLPQMVAPRVVRSSSPTTLNTWFSHFHLHFGRTETVTARPRPFSSQAPHAMPIVWRQPPEGVPPGRPSTRSYRSLDHGQSLPRLDGSLAVRHSIFHRTHIVTAAANRQVPLRRAEQTLRVFGRPPSGHVVAPNPARRGAAVDTSVRHLTVWRQQRVEPSEAAASKPAAAKRLPELAWRTPPKIAAGTRGEAARAGVSDSPMASKQLVAKRPPELVWRAPAKTAVGPLNETAGTEANGSTMTSMRATSFRAGGSAKASQAGAIAKARPMPFDPSLVDRLAEDVIRRVERRVRIDRERRGI